MSNEIQSLEGIRKSVYDTVEEMSVEELIEFCPPLVARLQEEVRKKVHTMMKKARTMMKNIPIETILLSSPEFSEVLFLVAEEYKAQSAHYKKLGWLTTKGGKEGIKDKEGRFYPMPTLKEVYEVLSEQLERLQYKANQGFKRFILAPIGLSYKDMYIKLTHEYQYYPQRNSGLGLNRTTAYKSRSADWTGSLYFSDAMEKEENCYYYPNTLSSKDHPSEHGGKTKQELIKSSRFPGWEIHFLPEDCTIARAGKQGEKEKGGRVPLPAGLCYGSYPLIMSGEGTRWDRDKDGTPYSTTDEAGRFVFEGESGLIPEVWVSLAFQQLRKEERLLNDSYKNDNDSAAVLTGILTIHRTGINYVPISYYDGSFLRNRLELHVDHPHTSDDHDGILSSVKVC